MMLWKQILGGIARTIIAATGGALITNGTLTADEVNTIVGGFGVLIPAIWSAFEKTRR